MNGRVPERISNIEKTNSVTETIENVKGNSQSQHQNEMDTQSKAWEKCTDSAIRLGTQSIPLRCPLCGSPNEKTPRVVSLHRNALGWRLYLMDRVYIHMNSSNFATKVVQIICGFGGPWQFRDTNWAWSGGFVNGWFHSWYWIHLNNSWWRFCDRSIPPSQHQVPPEDMRMDVGPESINENSPSPINVPALVKPLSPSDRAEIIGYMRLF